MRFIGPWSEDRTKDGHEFAATKPGAPAPGLFVCVCYLEADTSVVPEYCSMNSSSVMPCSMTAWAISLPT